MFYDYVNTLVYCHLCSTLYIPWRSNSGEIILIRCFYCPEASGTILSLSDINAQYSDRYTGWVMDTDYDSKTGNFKLIARDGIHHLTFSAYSENQLWYHYLNQVTNSEYDKLGSNTRAVVRNLTGSAAYELWHHHLGHPGDTVMSNIHKYVTGVPKLRRPKFYSCALCMSAKLRKAHIGTTKKYVKTPTDPIPCEPGQHIHIDFGFVRGSDWSMKDTDGKLVTSIDGYRSYCLLIDRSTQYIWIILTKRKTPPVVEVRHLLSHLKSKVKSTYKTVTTDLGGELARSKEFQKMLIESDINYQLRTTGAHSSAQNGLAEKPNQDLARMMRSMLYGAGLSSKYWTYALRHAVYLKNRLPHVSLGLTTPYEAINKVKPDLSRLRVFGSRAHFMHNERAKKLDKMDRAGTFLTFKGTDKIAYVIDEVTGCERVVTHVTYDEAHSSLLQSKQPPMASAIQQSGYTPSTVTNEAECEVKVRLLDKDTQLPVQATTEAAGLDIHAQESITIPSGEQVKISTKLAMEIPVGYHGQIHVRSSLAAKHRARVEAGIIDSDYRGEIFVLLSNNGQSDFDIVKGERIAQIIIVKDPMVTVKETNELSTTVRNKGGFGSTGKYTPTNKPSATPSPIPMPPVQMQPTTAAAATAIAEHIDNEPICNIDISADPFIDTQDVIITTKGRHPTQGLILQDSDIWDDRVTIVTCKPGMAATNVLNWRKRLKYGTLLQINNVPITSKKQAETIFSNIDKGTEVRLKIGLDGKLPMNEAQGVPMMYFDQLHTIATHLQHIQGNNHNKRINPEETKQGQNNPIQKAINVLTTAQEKVVAKLTGILPKSKVKSKVLTRKKLKGTKEWQQWKMSKWKQLDQYHGQGMFGEPCELPPGANVLNLLWYYNVKDDGCLKARMVCNGRPSNKNTVIFGHTYAKSLDHVGSRIFWATAAAKNFVVRGADASNAFAEADTPKIPLYARPNDQYREWWHEKMKRDPIPRGHVLPVHKALQGHPEAPRAWATLIDTILRTKLGFKPTTHKPCLYHGTYKGKEVLFLRQVDDFAVAAKTADIAMDIIKEIDKYMMIDIKDLGQLDRYNGVDIVQGRHYIKLNNPTYLRKIINEHIDESHIANQPVPMNDSKDHIRAIETAIPPSSEMDQRNLQVEMNFNYCQAIGELIFAMVTCRPDISFLLIKLSQYSANPAKIH
jgi:dUTP pyrophosphatase